MGQRGSVYLADDLAAAVKASGQPLAELIRRGLAAGTAEVAQPTAPAPASPCLAALPDGEPSPGTLCMGPGCLERSTSRYGLRRMPLCRACGAALTGETYQRPVTPAQARAIGGGQPSYRSRPGGDYEEIASS
jgi:hypothetical protein